MENTLIDLLNTELKKHFDYVPLNSVISIAQKLIENGVIVPLCRVGDRVYFYKAEIDEVCPAKVIKICNNFYTPSMPLWITIEYDSKLIGKYEETMPSDVFKLLCHYNREKAKDMLKECIE